MDQATIWLSIFILVTLVALRAPAILRLNQGKIIRNMALWMLIALGLALFYHLFGPFDSATSSLPSNPAAVQEEADIKDGNGRPRMKDDLPELAPKGEARSGEKSYTPPDE